LSAFTTSTTTYVSEAQTFALSNLGNANNFAALFDQYRIEAIRFIIKPRANATTVANNCSGYWCYVDYDNATVPTTISAVASVDNAVPAAAWESVERVFRPHVAVAAFGTAFNQYANMQNLWIDTSSSTVVHYGIKLYAQIDAVVTSYDIYIQYYLEFRNII
jgi:hypothetical protein